MSHRPLVALGALALVAGCGLFDLRDPKEPSGEEIIWDQQLEPRIALKNLEVATENRSVANFERSLTADYKFDFFDGDAAGLEYTRDQDMQALTRLFQNEAEIDLTWTVADSSPGDPWIYRNLKYLLVFRRSAADTTAYAGQCNLYFRQDGVQWFIYRWEDGESEAAPHTWGYARLNP